MAARPRISGQEPPSAGHPTESCSSTTQPFRNFENLNSLQSRTNTKSSPTTGDIHLQPDTTNSLNLEHQQCIMEMETNRDRVLGETFDIMAPFSALVYCIGQGFLLLSRGVLALLGIVVAFVIMALKSVSFVYYLVLFSLLFFILVRHRVLVARRVDPKTTLRGWRHSSTPHYALIVCGSGGHTSEMIKMIKQSIRPEENSHRRWVIATDDKLSFEKVLAFERELGERFGQRGLRCGTFDILYFRRGRAVHQSWFTTPWTSFCSLIYVLRILLTVPSIRRIHGLQFPGVIVTDGPGTGFLFLLAAHFLKLFYIAPDQYMKTVFIESWARATSLSLSGKLVCFFELADVFVVQHQDLATRYNKTYTKNMVVMPTSPPVPT
ncbi:glycosyltransferase family 1 protein [Xylariaceae sp. FL0662B]|nr:glycosyltransferase family 1 protein [Xylariaceae sp. FL0662B]